MNIPYIGPLLDRLPTWFIMMLLCTATVVGSVVGIRYVDALEKPPEAELMEAVFRENSLLRQEMTNLRNEMAELNAKFVLLKQSCGQFIQLPETGEEQP